MPYRLPTHVLTVDPSALNQVDTGNLENLASMWSVFSKCADSVEQGKRLENLSWRLWQREQLCCKVARPITFTTSTTSTSTTSTFGHPATLPREIPSVGDLRIQDLPQLSGSVDSLADDDEAVVSASVPLDFSRPRIRRQDSGLSHRRDSRHHHHHHHHHHHLNFHQNLMASDSFDKMVASIIQAKVPPSAHVAMAPAAAPAPRPLPAATTVAAAATVTAAPQPQSQPARIPFTPALADQVVPSSVDSFTDVTPRTQIVRGFSPRPTAAAVMPRTVSCETKPDPADAIPEPTSSPAPKAVQPKKQPAKFALGASFSSSEQSPPKPLVGPVAAVAAKMFRLGPSFSSGSAASPPKKPALRTAGSLLTAQKKQTSFSNHVMMRTIEPSEEAAIDDSDTEGDVDESAIEDDDESSEWEDSVEESNKSSLDDKVFRRVPSKVTLPSRRSLITLMVERQERAHALATQSTSALPQACSTAPGLAAASSAASSADSSDEGLMMKPGPRPSLLRPAPGDIPRIAAQPIVSQCHQVFGETALSPRTTRRNMLATELTASLRRHLLWERQQKTATVNAVLKRRHTAQDVANLRQYPERPCLKKEEDLSSSSFNHWFSRDVHNGYHSKGW